MSPNKKKFSLLDDVGFDHKEAKERYRERILWIKERNKKTCSFSEFKL